MSPLYVQTCMTVDLSQQIKTKSVATLLYYSVTLGQAKLIFSLSSCWLEVLRTDGCYLLLFCVIIINIRKKGHWNCHESSIQLYFKC